MSYGFSMHYNPWTGWSMGTHYSSGFVMVSVHGGYWGPPMYRPPYHPPYHGGYYGRGPVNINGDVNINVDRSNNIYNNRKDVSTRDVPRGNPSNSNKARPRTSDANSAAKNQPANQPAGSRAGNNMYSGKDGNVYQKKENGNWQQRGNSGWQDTNRDMQPSLDQQQQSRDRGQTRDNNFNQSNRGGNMGGRAGGMRRR